VASGNTVAGYPVDERLQPQARQPQDGGRGVHRRPQLRQDAPLAPDDPGDEGGAGASTVDRGGFAGSFLAHLMPLPAHPNTELVPPGAARSSEVTNKV